MVHCATAERDGRVLPSVE